MARAAASRDGAGAAECGECGLAAAPAGVREADDDLSGADRSDAIAGGEAGGGVLDDGQAAARPGLFGACRFGPAAFGDVFVRCPDGPVVAGGHVDDGRAAAPAARARDRVAGGVPAFPATLIEAGALPVFVALPGGPRRPGGGRFPVLPLDRDGIAIAGGRAALLC